jgi:hypothetical protein
MPTRFRFRRLIWLAAALALLLGIAYVQATRPEALRTRLVRLLEEFDLRVVRLGGISFSPTAGLEVLDLEVAAGENSAWAGVSESSNRPPLLQVPHTRVSVNPWMLLLGKFQPRAVELDAPAIAVVLPEDDRSASILRSAGCQALPGEIPASLPRLRVNRAELSVFAARDDGLRLQWRRVVDGRGTLSDRQGSEPRAYVLRFGPVGSLAGVKHGPSAPQVEVRLQEGWLIAESGWVDLELEQESVPERWIEFARRLGLSGRARVKRIALDSAGVACAEVECDRVRCALPVETDPEHAVADRFAQLADAAVTVSFERNDRLTVEKPGGLRGRLRLRLDGRLNNATATVDLSADDIVYRPRSNAGGDEQAAAGLLDDVELGTYRAQISADGLTLPTLKDNPRFVTSERLPEALRSWISKYDAEGRVNLHVTVEGDGPPEALRYRGELEALDGSCRYFRFPYRIADACGLVRFSNDGILFDGLCGRHGTNRIRLDGRLLNSESWTGFQLSFRGHNVVSDADLYAALPPEYQALWRSAAPVGLWDVQVRLGREHGSAETGSPPTEVRVDARLLSGSLKLDDGSTLEQADGLIHIAGGRIELDDLHGYLDGALVRVNGTLQSGDDASAQYDVHVEVADADLRRTSEVHDREGRFISQVEFEGTGNVWAQLSSGNRGTSHYAVNITDGVLTGFDARDPWTQAAGWISLRGDEQRIRTLTARREGGELAISGTLPTQLGLHSPIVLDLRASDEDLERLLRQLVPGRWSNIREALGLAGRGQLTAQFHPQETEGGQDQQAAEIRLEAERMRPTPLPLDLRDIVATLTLQANGFELHQATARYGEEGHITVSGHGGWSAGSLWTDICVGASDVELDPELVQAMPKPLAALLERMAPRGRLQLRLDQVLLTGTEQPEWNVVGQILLDDAELNVGLPLSGFAGRLQGSCRIRPDGRMELDGQFTIDRGRLADRPIERWEGRIVCRPDDKRVELAEVRGRLCGGEVVGFAEIDPDRSTYDLSFTLHDVSLDQFLPRRENKPGRAPRGRLDGHIFVRGDTENAAQRGGGGELLIRKTSLGSSPITASVAEASQREKRSISDEVEQAEVRFVWEGEELQLTRVDIHSRDLRLIGAGSWNMPSDAISLTLLGATPEDAPRLFPLTDLLETAGQELLQYRVEGTAAEPRVTIEPLHNLTEPLRQLLRGERAE